MKPKGRKGYIKVKEFENADEVFQNHARVRARLNAGRRRALPAPKSAPELPLIKASKVACTRKETREKAIQTFMEAHDQHVRDRAFFLRLPERAQRFVELCAEAKYKPTRAELLRQVSGITKIDIAEIRGGRRTKPLIYPRRLFSYVACRKFGYETTLAGKTLRRDHTTIIHSIYKFEEMLALGDERALADLEALT